MRVLITGAGDQTGRETIGFSHKRGVEVRGLSTRETTVAMLKER